MDAEDIIREAELLAYGVLHGPNLPALETLTRVAQQVFGTAVVEINVITSTRVRHLATSDGRGGESAPYSESICPQVLHHDEPTFVLRDAREMPEVADLKSVTGELASVVFYAASKLVSPEGTVLGTFCVYDFEQVSLDPESGPQLLMSMADAAVEVLEMHRTNVELAQTIPRLAQSHRQLDRSNANLEAFAGQVSHDLQGPLASVQVALDLVHQADVDPEDRLMLLERARAGVGRATELVHDLMAFAVIGGGDHHEEIDLAVVTFDAVADLQAMVGESRIDVQAMPSALGNRSQVRSVLQNLVANAVKFAGLKKAPEIVVRAERVGDRVRVCVIDNGPGVPAEERQLIFEHLRRGADQEVAGYGIGLGTCARIVAAHGGTIGVDEAPGGGALFHFDLPAA